MARYRIRVGRRISSAALMAEGQHARTDALTSLAVLLGVGGAMLGYPQVDAVVGLLIAAVILLVLWASMRTTLHRLMDGVEPQVLNRLEEVAASVPGVRTVRRTRARWSGHRMEADLEVDVDPGLTVGQADDVAHEVRWALTSTVPNLDGVAVHACAAPDAVSR